MTTLPGDDIAAALADLPGWDHVENAIRREFRFPTFPDAIAFVVRLAYDAEAANHHPDVDIRYSTVRVTLSTHSAGGVTDKDLALARAADALIPPQ